MDTSFLMTSFLVQRSPAVSVIAMLWSRSWSSLGTASDMWGRKWGNEQCSKPVGWWFRDYTWLHSLQRIISYYFIIQERGIPNKTKLFTEWPAGLDHLKAWGFHGSGRPPEAPGLVLQRASGPWVFQGPLCVGAAVTQLRQDNARHLKTILSLPGDVYGELWICKSIQPWLLAPNTCGRGHCPPGDFFLELITASISEPYAFESGLSVVKHPGHQPPGLRST